MQDQVVMALGEFFTRWQRLGGHGLVDYDKEFLSPAEYLPPRQGRVAWRPWCRPVPGSFDNLARALAMPIHPDLASYYGHYFAAHVTACFKGLFIDLLQPWNQDDFERLQENLIGHQLMQQRLGLPATWFLASCRDEHRLVCLDNHTGEVILERLGKGKIGVLAPTLAGFLGRLEPVRVGD
ncbi:SecY-interacting protein [Zobellella aerophila]|uniref:SecY-interacting protein n=1 Tax=Zobellella aerophila TaxID=870480 RepID=A0ABP6VJN0_9GAMM